MSNQMPDWVAPVLWGLAIGAWIVAVLFLVYVFGFRAGTFRLIARRNRSTVSGQSLEESRPQLLEHDAGRSREVSDCLQEAPEMVGAPTDPDDLAALRLLKGAHFGEGGRIVLPSGKSITSQQARELTQDS